MSWISRAMRARSARVASSTSYSWRSMRSRFLAASSNARPRRLSLVWRLDAAAAPPESRGPRAGRPRRSTEGGAAPWRRRRQRRRRPEAPPRRQAARGASHERHSRRAATAARDHRPQGAGTPWRQAPMRRRPEAATAAPGERGPTRPRPGMPPSRPRTAPRLGRRRPGLAPAARGRSEARWSCPAICSWADCTARAPRRQ